MASNKEKKPIIARYIVPRDSIVESVVAKFQKRSLLGIAKYGTTLDRTDLNTLDWINHAQEELMDGILYLERLKVSVSKTPDSAASATVADSAASATVADSTMSAATTSKGYSYFSRG
jgi:hypothetical protein